MATLAEIRAKLKSQEVNRSTSQTGGDNAIYPHWNINEGSEAVVRFLPDKDTNNTFFWTERNMIKLRFAGIKGQTDSRPIQVQVPCMEMYGKTCPVLTEVRPWFKDASLEDMGRKYWKKRSYIFQGFVYDNPLNEESPENPIRRFVISPQIFNIIKSALMDPDMENIPTDYVNGCDFKVTKTTKGQYADYSTSSWARKDTSLDETQLAAIDTNGLFNLSDYLPAQPTTESYQAIKEMFAASVDGELYDPARWGNFYRPYGVEVPAAAVQQTSVSAQATVSTTAPAVAETTAPAVQTPAPAPAPVAEPVAVATATAPVVEPDKGKKSADDILNLIRNRSTS